jgi:hypothetical protein
LQNPVLISGGQVLYLLAFVFPELHNGGPGFLHSSTGRHVPRRKARRWTLGIGKPKSERHASIQCRQD